VGHPHVALIVMIVTDLEQELRCRLANEEDIKTFAATIRWYIDHKIERKDLSPFEQMIWDRIITAVVRYWNPIDLACPF
jgi:hypothetical protein